MTKTMILRLFGLVALSVMLVLVIPSPRVEAAGDLTPALPSLTDYDTQNLRWLAQNHPSLYRQIAELSWVEDSLSELERDTIDQLLHIGVSDIPSLEATLGLPWVQDAISEVEYDVIDWLGNLGAHDTPILATIITMLFLQTPDTTDVLALRSMHKLAQEEALAPLMDHASVLDGITEDETTLVTAVGTLYRDIDEISRMLDPGYASIEVVTAATGLQSSIIRTGNQPQSWTADALADAVDFAERVMLLDLPVDHVILVLNDKAVPGTAAGSNYGFAISYLPEYEQMQDTFEGRAFQQGLVHEVAHYYWRGNENWIDESLANTIEYMHGTDNGLSPGQLKTRREDCEAHDLEMLSEWDAPTSSPEYYCNYYLGERLFLELRESLDDAEFSEKLRELYQLSLTAQEADQTPGIAAVRQVFIDQGGIVDKHWSGGLNAPENRPFDEGIDRISHDLIQWDQHPTYDGQEVALSGTLLDDAVLSSEIISQAREGGYSNFTLSLANGRDLVGFILPSLEGGRRWLLENPGDTVATVYQLYERSFTVKFPFPQMLDSPSDYTVIVWGFRDESRTPSIGENIDILGYARIRAENIAPTNMDEAGTVTLSTMKPQVGVELTATLGDPDGSVSGATWQWAGSSDGSTWIDITEAMETAYTPVAADEGNYLRATASYTDAEGSGKNATSAATANAVTGNTDPVFATTTAERSVAENTAAGENIGAAVVATDDDTGDTLTYTLGGTDMASFGIAASTGQLQVKAALDFETRTSYEVEVTATDGSGATAMIAVTITVIDESLGALGDTYDSNEDEMIDRDDLVAAVRAFRGNVIDRDDLVALVRLFQRTLGS